MNKGFQLVVLFLLWYYFIVVHCLCRDIFMNVTF